MYAPLILFTYNRPFHTQKVLESLNDSPLAKETDLYIFCDYPKGELTSKNIAVKNYLLEFKNISKFKSTTLYISDKHKGLANSVIDGVSSIINQYGKVIVNEDDLVCNIDYLKFMNDCLDYYQNNSDIWSISGWSPKLDSTTNNNVFATYRGSSWGWATWKDRWNTVNWDMKYYIKLKHSILSRQKIKKAGPDLLLMLDYQIKGKTDSWAVRWVCTQAIEHNKKTIYPAYSFVYNIGLDGSGTHSEASGNEVVQELTTPVSYTLNQNPINKKQLNEFNCHYAITPFPLNYIKRIYNHFFVWKKNND